MIEPKIITQPTSEPITVEEFEAHGRLTVSAGELSLVQDIYIPAARRQIETLTGRTSHATTLEWTPVCFPSDRFIVLPRATPLVSITSVTLKASDETTSAWSSSYYLPDTDSAPGRLVLRYGQQWPSFTHSPVSPIRIRYVAGIATTSPLTEADAMVKELACLLVGDMYENREGQVVSDRANGDFLQNMRVAQLIAALRVEYAF